MSRLFTLAIRAIFSPEKFFIAIANNLARKEDRDPEHNDGKFFIDTSGAVILNRKNAEVQKAFADNVAGLSTKENG